MLRKIFLKLPIPPLQAQSLNSKLIRTVVPRLSSRISPDKLHRPLVLRNISLMVHYRRPHLTIRGFTNSSVPPSEQSPPKINPVQSADLPSKSNEEKQNVPPINKPPINKFGFKWRKRINAPPSIEENKEESQKKLTKEGRLSIYLLLLTVLLYFISDLIKNKANQNRTLLLEALHNECKQAIIENNALLLEAHIADPQTRLLFYNEKSKDEIKQYLERDVALDTKMIVNRLIQDRLGDLLSSARAKLGEVYESDTINRAEKLLAQQRRQYYRLLIAKRLNLAIILHKQGQYTQALEKLSEIETLYPEMSVSASPPQKTFYRPKQDTERGKRHADYLPQGEHLEDELAYLKERDFVKNIFINTYNIKGMIIRSLVQRKDKRYSLHDAEDCFNLALGIKRHPVILSNLAFLLNRMALDVTPVSESDRDKIKGLREKALSCHTEASQNKLGDGNDPAILNGLGFGLLQMEDPKVLIQALGYIDRALVLKPNDRDIRENKAAILLAIAKHLMSAKDEAGAEKRLVEAAECLQKVVETNDELVDTYILFARIAKERLRRREGRNCLDLGQANKLIYNDQLHWYNTEAEIESIRKSLDEQEKLKRPDRSDIGVAYCKPVEKGTAKPSGRMGILFPIYSYNLSNSKNPNLSEAEILRFEECINATRSAGQI